MSLRPEKFCLRESNPISFVQGMNAALGVNLELFRTPKVVASHPDFEVEFMTQRFKDFEVNVDETGKESWACEAVEKAKFITTLSSHAQYQQSFRKDKVKLLNLFVMNLAKNIVSMEIIRISFILLLHWTEFKL